ncbi:MAG TPA: aldo/keto reductase [Nocardioidaceae bacterium]|jgi:aryl-alcohol dehydrogenase-like predicted oxidoreductase|nr:aldo/keto reductase [Nocardioidaceae bacterium]
MQIRTLGRSGCAVSAFALGSMTFGRETDEAGSREQLDTYVESGGNLVDTADVYADTESESIIGRWLVSAAPGVRERVVLATKGRFPTDDSPNGVGLSRRHLSMALDASLRRLRVDTIDLYQVHAWDPLTPLEETMRFVDDAVSAGKVRYFGLSNFTAWQVQRTVTTADFRGWTRPVTVQPQYNLLAREIEWEIVPACRSEGLGLLPWSPLGGGWLTGKYARDEPPAGATRLGENPDVGVEAYGRRSALERTWDVVGEVRTVAEELGVPMAAVALAWLRDRPAVSAVILGARTTDQLRANLAAADLVLSDDQVRGLDAASDPGAADYPYGGAGIDQRSRRLEGGR